MRTCHYTLVGRDIQQRAVEALQQFFRLPDFSGKCPAGTVWLILCAAAARMSSLFATCRRLRDAPSDETVRQALLATLPSYAETQRRANRALQGYLPEVLRRRRQILAIDPTLIPYHGKPYRDAKEIYGGKPKSGTSHFHAYATAYVVCRGLRYTVAVTPVRQGDKMKVVVQRLLHLAGKAGIKPRLLLLDRGFYSVEVIRYLQAARVPFVMPAVARGPRLPGPPRGIRVYQLWKKGGWGEHTLRDVRKRAARVKICVHCGNYRGRQKKHGRFAWVYAYWGFTPATTRWLADTYRQRFGIETSFRQLHQGRVRTSTRNPLLRFLYAALALILRNLWVWLHWHQLSSPRRGRRQLHLERCRLKHLLAILLHAVELKFSLDDDIPSERPPSKLFMAA